MIVQWKTWDWDFVFTAFHHPWSSIRFDLHWWQQPGWFDRKRMGRLGQLHRFSFACIRERARCPGSRRILGSSRALQRRQCWELPAPSYDRNQARPHFHACNHGIHHPRNYRQIPWFLVSFCWLEVCRCAQWPCRNLQSASCRVGTDFGIHGLLRSFPRPVPWNCSLCWRLWMEAHYLWWPRSEENQT